MNIVFYINNSDNRTLNKSLTELSSADISLKDENEIMRPVITLSAAYLPPSANYAYIEKFSRFYFINGQRILTGNRLEITLKEDVLMSWRVFLTQHAQVIAERSSNVPNKKLPDNVPVLANRNVIYKKFNGASEGFGSQTISADSKCYCLTVLNGNVKLDPPARLELTQISGTLNIKATWSAITGANFYNVDIKQDVGEWERVVSATVFTQATFIAPKSGLLYVRVVSADASGNISGEYATSSIEVVG